MSEQLLGMIDFAEFVDSDYQARPEMVFLEGCLAVQVLSIRYAGFTAPNGQRIHDRWCIRIFDFSAGAYAIYPYTPNQPLVVYAAEIEDGS